MPKVTTSDKLIELVQRSELIAKDQLARFLAKLTSDRGGLLPGSPEQLADLFIDAGLLTPWQAEQLLKGRYRGFRLGKYTLKGHLGTGGMSSVYLSEHPIMRRPVAIKVLPKSRVTKSSYLERFELEARAVAALDHPNIVRAYDIDNEADTHYIVMEYVEGKDLQRLVEMEGPLSYERAADYVAQAAVGLQHAHEAGVVHRDIKPANCLVETTGTVKVLDMGLAKFAQDEQSLSAVHKDSVVGTADYLAPEQAVNSSRVDARADVYGLGGTLYFLLTGHPPFPEGTLTERLLKHQKEEPKSIFDDRPDAPAILVDICRRMMAKRPDDRIQTASDVAQQLRGWLAGRGYSRDAAGSETKSLRAGSFGGLNSNARWQQYANTSATPYRTNSPTTGSDSISGPGSGTGQRGDTVSASGSDTRKISAREEDLTLAPIDEEVTHRSGSGTGSSTIRGATTSDVHLDETVLSRIEEELGSSNSTSGSLVDLLENKHLAKVSTSGVRLPSKPKPKPIWPFVLSGIAILVVIGLFVAILLS